MRSGVGPHSSNTDQGKLTISAPVLLATFAPGKAMAASGNNGFGNGVITRGTAPRPTSTDRVLIFRTPL